MPKRHNKCLTLRKVLKIAAFFAHFGIFSETFTNFVCHSDLKQQTKSLFVAVTQCDKQNKSLLQ